MHVGEFYQNTIFLCEYGGCLYYRILMHLEDGDVEAWVFTLNKLGSTVNTECEKDYGAIRLLCEDFLKCLLAINDRSGILIKHVNFFDRVFVHV